MNFGFFSLPLGPLILLVSVIAALVAGHFAGRRAAVAVDQSVFNALIVGLVAARLVFIGRYLPGYDGSVVKMLDFRDLGFDMAAGAIAGALVVAWTVLRRPALRKPLLIAMAAGVATWSAATVAAQFAQPPQFVPQVSLVDSDGQLRPLARHDGKPLVVNLWATWCPPCQAEMPVLAQAQTDHPRVDLVFVNQGETRTVVDGYLASHDIRIANSMFDPGLAVARAVGAAGFPTTLFYDAQGRLLARHLGGFSRATFEQALEQFYPESPAHKQEASR
ncbi:TlpA disulfide reductase family protein [Paraburkholderia rhizosphaerae]|nr:TlpA disulfide reductase family protein [Paraburkholderia rhizosphaerae]